MKEHGRGPAQGQGWLLVIPALAALALLFYGLWGRTGKVTLYFADKDFRSLVAETREAPLIGGMEERAAEVLDELVLGPMEPDRQPLLQGDARLGTVMLRGGVLTVDIEVAELGSQKLPFGLLKRAIEQSLSDSVPGYGRLELHMNGRQAGG